jgi:hypothetical protein
LKVFDEALWRGYAPGIFDPSTSNEDVVMRTMCWISCVLCTFVTVAATKSAEPNADKGAPFWELPKSTINLQSLAPADVKFIAGPDTQRGLILLQTGAEAPATDFVPTRPELRALVAEKDSGYQIIPKGLAIGALPFGDRKYKVAKLPPAFVGLTLLQTKMGHKAVADGNYSVTVEAAKPCLVFLALDERVIETYKEHGTPGWLQEYTPTGESIRTDEPVMAEADAGFQVYVRKSAGGRIVFGPPSMDVQYNAMYFAFFGEAKP